MIEIKTSKTADTRSCDFTNVTKEQLVESSKQHINDVKMGLKFFQNQLELASTYHDFDKISNINSFHHDFIGGFEETTWWDNHRRINRHHLLQEDGIPADVNLIDVLEMITDCIMAGMARTGSAYPLTINPDVLMTAFENTAKLLKRQIIVKE